MQKSPLCIGSPVRLVKTNPSGCLPKICCRTIAATAGEIVMVRRDFASREPHGGLRLSLGEEPATPAELLHPGMLGCRADRRGWRRGSRASRRSEDSVDQTVVVGLGLQRPVPVDPPVLESDSWIEVTGRVKTSEPRTTCRRAPGDTTPPEMGAGATAVLPQHNRLRPEMDEAPGQT